MERKRLPDRRRSWTQSATVGGQRVFLDVGFYPDGTPGEVFLDVAKAGSGVRGFSTALARVLSVAIQHGVPLDALAESLAGIDFEPRGLVVGSPTTAHAKSIVDYLAQELKELRPTMEFEIDLTTRGRGV